jgi:hypothetical protein
MEKVNVVFNRNGTVSYQEKISFSFVPELSAFRQPHHDYIAVPNIPLLVSTQCMAMQHLGNTCLLCFKRKIYRHYSSIKWPSSVKFVINFGL